MKITFVEPPKEDKKLPVERVFGCTYSLYSIPNIFNLYVASMLRKNGIEVFYKDASAENISKKKFLEFISNDNSDIYYVHSVNLSLRDDIKLSQQILELRKGASIIFAGPGPTYYSENYIYGERVYVVRGEAEATALELVNALKKNEEHLGGIRGISFMREGKITHNSIRPLLNNLDELPFPARDIVKRGLYYNPKLPGGYFTPLLSSRNCSYNCIFCVPNSQSFAVELEYKKCYGRKPPTRLRGAENIIEEMREVKKAGYKFVSIIDDQFLWDEKRSLEICRGLKGLGIKWGCLARCDRIKEEIAKAMHEAGCEYVDLGVESFSQDVLDYTKKNLKVRDIYNSVSILKKYRIKAKINILLGTNPFETEKDLWHNVDECIRLKPDAVMFSIVCPFPGTAFYDIAKKNRWLRGGEYSPVSVQHDSILNLPNLDQEKLRRIIKKANLRFYMRPGFIVKNILRLAYPRNAFYTIRALYRKMAG
jgi:radical SAM superfamily enzyme YgiQ (UPF0313 family)